MSKLPPWDSDEFDREVRAARKQPPLDPMRRTRRDDVLTRGRGPATDEELARPKRAERAMKEDD